MLLKLFFNGWEIIKDALMSKCTTVPFKLINTE